MRLVKRDSFSRLDLFLQGQFMFYEQPLLRIVALFDRPRGYEENADQADKNQRGENQRALIEIRFDFLRQKPEIRPHPHIQGANILAFGNERDEDIELFLPFDPAQHLLLVPEIVLNGMEEPDARRTGGIREGGRQVAAEIRLQRLAVRDHVGSLALLQDQRDVFHTALDHLLLQKDVQGIDDGVVDGVLLITLALLVLEQKFETGRSDDGDPLGVVLLKPALRAVKKIVKQGRLEKPEDDLKGNKDGYQDNDVPDLEPIPAKPDAELIGDAHERRMFDTLPAAGGDAFRADE